MHSVATADGVADAHNDNPNIYIYQKTEKVINNNYVTRYDIVDIFN